MKISTLSKIIFFAVCLFLIIPSPLSAEKMTDKWRITGYTKYRDGVFADISRIASPTPETKSIWVKLAPSNRSPYLRTINEYLQTVNKSDKGFKSIEILCEINCATHLIRFTKYVYFDNTGNIIHEVDDTNPGWFLIWQGNIWFYVEKVACGERK